jgi:hypothetical protein
MSTCCSWGSAQEAASLLQVARAFPLSQLAEVRPLPVPVLVLQSISAVC